VTCEDAILQFGKESPHDFMMDFRYPLSALQAFAIILTKFDSSEEEDDVAG
jgi:tubby and related proteins